MMHGHEKSGPVVVAMKPANKTGEPAAEPVERRAGVGGAKSLSLRRRGAGAEGNANQRNTRRAQNRESVTQALARVRQAARQRKKEPFRHYETVLWQKTLRRRSQKDRFSWDRISRLVDEWLPRRRILHPWPSVRFAARHKRWEPYAGKPHVRFCAEGAQ